MSDSVCPNSLSRMDRNFQLLQTVHGEMASTTDIGRVLKQVVKAVRQTLDVDGVLIVLNSGKETSVRFIEVQFQDPVLMNTLSKIRSYKDLDVFFQVYNTGQPILIADYSFGQHRMTADDPLVKAQVRHLAAVPVGQAAEPTGIVLIANQKNVPIHINDRQLLEMIGVLLSLRIENINLRSDLNAASQRVAHFNLAKDRVIQRFSHELKTPLAVLIASFKLLEKRMAPETDAHWQAVLVRTQRNLERLLNMEYELEDILREREEEDISVSVPRSQTVRR